MIVKRENNISGGGSYDQIGNQKKIGKWVELDENFWINNEITYNGEYNMNNMKVGRWDIMYCEYDGKEYKQINISNLQLYIYSGGGLYDQDGNQKKIRKWVELDEKFYKDKQVTFNGEHNIKGEKVGIWVQMNNKKNEIRGEKKYDN